MLFRLTHNSKNYTVLELELPSECSELATMVGVYHQLWNPGALNVKRGKHIYPVLRDALSILQNYYPAIEKSTRRVNPWGSRVRLSAVIEQILVELKKNPNLYVEVVDGE